MGTLSWLLAALLVVSGRQESKPVEVVAAVEAVEELEVDEVPAGEYLPVPDEVACRELVHLITDYLDGVLPPEWRRGLDDHLAECDGCTEYLRQIRAVIDAVERLAAETGVRPVGGDAG